MLASALRLALFGALSLVAPLLAPAAAPTAILSILADGAAVTVDGTPRGTAPLTLRDIPADTRVIVRLELAGYEPQERAFTLLAGAARVWDAQLTPLHPGLELTTAPGAEVVAVAEDGARIPLGVADAHGAVASGGRLTGDRYKLEIVKEGYETGQQTVTLDRRAATKVTVVLRPQPARARIVSVPPVTEVYVNNAKLALAHGVVEVPADADVTLEVRREGYAAKSRQARVARGREEVVNFGTLDPVSGRMRIAVLTPQGPVPADFHAQARAFVDSREVPWNRGTLAGVASGRREITVMHEAYQIAGDGLLVIDVKENAVSEATLRAEVKPARIRITPTWLSAGGKPTTNPAGLKITIDGREVPPNPEGLYEAPTGRAFSATVEASEYKAQSQTFPALKPGDESTQWSVTARWDPEKSLQHELRLMEAKIAALHEDSTRMRRRFEALTEITQRDFTDGRRWLEEKRPALKAVSMAHYRARLQPIEENFAAIEKVLRRYKPEVSPSDHPRISHDPAPFPPVRARRAALRAGSRPNRLRTHHQPVDPGPHHVG